MHLSFGISSANSLGKRTEDVVVLRQVATLLKRKQKRQKRNKSQPNNLNIHRPLRGYL
jgi:hypothetical protein